MPNDTKFAPDSVLQATALIMPHVVLGDDPLPLAPSGGGRSDRCGNRNQVRVYL